MNKAIISSLLIVALLALAQAHTLPRIELNNGYIRYERNLETTKLQTHNLTKDTYTIPVVNAHLGSTFLEKNNLPAGTLLPMFIFPFTSISGFVRNYASFKDYTCDATYCTENATAPRFQFLSPYFKMDSSSNAMITANLSINSSDGTATNPWKLTNQALFLKSSSYMERQNSYYHLRDYSTTYITGSNYVSTPLNKTYGWIGLGIDGDAKNNFANSAEPIFSIKMDGVGKGNIYFGDNTTLYDSKTVSQTFTTDANWTMYSRNISFGTNTTAMPAHLSHVIFDQNFDGIGIPDHLWRDTDSALKAAFIAWGIKDNSTLGRNIDDAVFLSYVGDISLLPNLVIGLTNDKNLTIPPSIYMELVNGTTNVYACKIVRAMTSSDYSTPSTSMVTKNYTILGVPILKNYAVFSQPKNSNPQVKLYMIGGTVSTSSGSSGSSSLWYIIIGIIAFILIFIAALVQKSKSKGSENSLQSSLNKPSIGLELR